MVNFPTWSFGLEIAVAAAVFVTAFIFQVFYTSKRCCGTRKDHKKLGLPSHIIHDITNPDQSDYETLSSHINSGLKNSTEKAGAIPNWIEHLRQLRHIYPIVPTLLLIALGTTFISLVIYFDQGTVVRDDARIATYLPWLVYAVTITAAIVGSFCLVGAGDSHVGVSSTIKLGVLVASAMLVLGGGMTYTNGGEYAAFGISLGLYIWAGAYVLDRLLTMRHFGGPVALSNISTNPNFLSAYSTLMNLSFATLAIAYFLPLLKYLVLLLSQEYTNVIPDIINSNIGQSMLDCVYLVLLAIFAIMVDARAAHYKVRFAKYNTKGRRDV